MCEGRRLSRASLAARRISRLASVKRGFASARIDSLLVTHSAKHRKNAAETQPALHTRPRTRTLPADRRYCFPRSSPESSAPVPQLLNTQLFVFGSQAHRRDHLALQAASASVFLSVRFVFLLQVGDLADGHFFLQSLRLRKGSQVALRRIESEEDSSRKTQTTNRRHDLLLQLEILILKQILQPRRTSLAAFLALLASRRLPLHPPLLLRSSRPAPTACERSRDAPPCPATVG